MTKLLLTYRTSDGQFHEAIVNARNKEHAEEYLRNVRKSWEVISLKEITSSAPSNECPEITVPGTRITREVERMVFH